MHATGLVKNKMRRTKYNHDRLRSLVLGATMLTPDIWYSSRRLAERRGVPSVMNVEMTIQNITSVQLAAHDECIMHRHSAKEGKFFLERRTSGSFAYGLRDYGALVNRESRLIKRDACVPKNIFNTDDYCVWEAENPNTCDEVRVMAFLVRVLQ